ncbi:MAG: hypothetical protein MUF64_23610 [Polyangiaceae bacterium]|nr:hypothetical protein [Polyangiaceae bacterium]
MAQQVQRLPLSRPVALDCLDHPSPNHTFLVGVLSGVLAVWGFTLYLAATFHG